MAMSFRLFESPRRRHYMLSASVAIAMGLILAIALSFGEFPEDTTDKQIAITESFTIKNAAKLGIEVKPDGSAVYAAFYRSNDGVTNTYLIHSKEGVKAFSDPVRVNKKSGEAEEVWYPVSLEFSPANEIYVLWAIKRKDVAFRGRGVRDFKFAKSTDGGKSFGPSLSPAHPQVRDGFSIERTFFDLAFSNKGTPFLSYLALGIHSEKGVAEYTG